MDKIQEWYTQKKLERIATSLLRQQYLIHIATSQEEAIEILFSQIQDETSVMLGDTWNFHDFPFIKRLERQNSNILDLSKRREQLLSKIAILEGDFVTPDGEIILVGDYNVSLGIFASEIIYIFLSQNALVKNISTAIKKIKDLKIYYTNRAKEREIIQENVGIGIIDNGRKFEKRIYIILYEDPFLIL